MSAPSPISENTDLVSYVIMVNGKEISGDYEVVSIYVDKKLNKIPYATIQILDGSASNEDFPISDSGDFVPGNEIKIDLGYHSKVNNVFTGIIIKHGIRIRQKKAALLILECRDKAINMTIGRKNAVFTKEKDSDIIESIIGTYGLNKEVQATAATLKQTVQYYSTDWDFMLSRADINGQVVIADNGKITIQKPDTSSMPVLEIIYGDSIWNLDAEMDARTQLSSVKCLSWDMKTQATINADSKDPGFTLPGDISNASLSQAVNSPEIQLQSTANIEADSLQSWADARFAKSMIAKIRGTINFQGSSLVSPGKLIQLSGVGARFNGNAYVSAVSHVLENGEWTTEAELGISPEWYAESVPDIMSPQASGLLPATEGMLNGVVQKIDSDPDSEFRVQVKIPLISDSEGIWARLSTFYATGNAGSFFYPEVGDEVLVSFLNNDPRYPVVIGSLYSSTKTPPYTPDEKNTYKGVVTKNQLKIVFDDEKKIAEISTPANNKIIMSEEDKTVTISDQNNNTITMSSSGISINSASDIEIKATSNVKISAGADVKIAATANADISGMNVSAKADVQATVEGSASAKLTASGEVTVQGAMVMIN